MRFATPLLIAAALASTALARPVPRTAPPAASIRAIAAALADPGRPAADRERDTSRHATELLAFMGVKPGDKVADFIMGGGYWTRVLAPLVGPAGKVYAYQPAEFIQYRAAYGTEQDAAVAGRANVVANRDSLGAIHFAEPLDAIITVQNWHDLHLHQSPPGASALIAHELFAALKPGGTLLVVDHVGANPTPFAVADTLHRGDPAATRAEMEAAGFRFDGSLPVLANPADPHTALVFDPAIRGHTDQFVYRFRKPR
ncbi:class I SAM-dependent methyltransferase [Sphingomonas sp.]|uniref:class I SAM-dependent methyltransferase n=1 Tax=Sphingomonas sp. TaxID=28214 RepID=UPI003CC61FB2